MAGNRFVANGWVLGVSAAVLLSAGLSARAQDGEPAKAVKPPKYPLRFHVLAADEAHLTVRFQPQYDSGNVPDVSTGVIAGGGGGGSTSSYTSFGGDDDYTGRGRGDLVSPPHDTAGVSFTYEGCNRIKVLTGFQSLPARWKVQGKKLEVLFPSQEIPDGDKPLKSEKCTLKVTMHEFIYLRVKSGNLIQVSQEDYWKKPSLRMFLSGPSETLQRCPERTALKATPPPE